MWKQLSENLINRGQIKKKQLVLQRQNANNSGEDSKEH